MIKKFVITVEWCGNGKRGIFCMENGINPWKETKHTQDEIIEQLGLFDLILKGKSEHIPNEELKKYTRWRPLAEFKKVYGIMLKEV